MEEWLKILLTSSVTLLASGGFWSYRQKKLERKYQQEDKSSEIHTKLDTLINNNTDIVNKLDHLTVSHKKTNDVTMAVARDRIYHLCKKWKEEENYHPDNMRDLIDLMAPYKANDGDGIADEYFDKYSYDYKTKGGN